MIITRLCYAPAVWERSWGQTQLWPAPRSVIREEDRPTLEHLLQADYKPRGARDAFGLWLWTARVWERGGLPYGLLIGLFPWQLHSSVKAAERSMKSRLTAQWLRCSGRRQTERKTIRCDKTCRCDCPPRLTAFWKNTQVHTHVYWVSEWRHTTAFNCFYI